MRVGIFLLLFCFSIVSETYRRTEIDKIQSEILKAFEKTDVVIWGEEHNDRQGHSLQLEILRYVSEKQDIALSLEMLETDQQTLVDEYWSGKISESSFLQALRSWTNYKEDYHPLVKFAKEKKIPVVCANAPKRYVSLVSSQGFVAITTLSPEALQFLPPLYLWKSGNNPKYEQKIKDVMTTHVPKNFENFLLAQNLWDATMAHSILQAKTRYSRKVFHINGRFHSDDGLGVTSRIRLLGEGVYVISVFPENAEEEKTRNEKAQLVILTDSKKDGRD